MLPVHIVLLQLLIDPACAIVFEAEPEAADLMRRPPRPVTDSPFALQALRLPLLQGLGIAALLLAAQTWLLAQGWSAALLGLPGLRDLMRVEGAGLPSLAAIAAVLALSLAWLVLLRRLGPGRAAGWRRSC